MASDNARYRYCWNGTVNTTALGVYKPSKAVAPTSQSIKTRCISNIAQSAHDLFMKYSKGSIKAHIFLGSELEFFLFLFFLRLALESRNQY